VVLCALSIAYITAATLERAVGSYPAAVTYALAVMTLSQRLTSAPPAAPSPPPPFPPPPSPPPPTTTTPPAGRWELPTSEESIKEFLDTLVRCHKDLYW
jgi:hypothetical protein